MSKIKVDTIESSNQNVKLAPNGTGVVEVKVAGGADGTLKLVSSNGSNAVKIKSPAHSAGQSYTMVLPDNQPTVDKYVKVKSITGSGATATGQLEYATVPTADLTQLNASDITSGTVSSDRFPATPLATAGAGFKLISKSTVTTSGVASITVSLPSQNARYLMYCKRICFSNSTYPRFELLNASGSNIQFSNITLHGYSESTTQAFNYTTHWYYGGWSREDYGFILEISNTSDTSTRSTIMGKAYGIARDEMKCETYTYTDFSANAIHSMRFTPWDNTGSYPRTIEPNTEILLYQYNE